MENNNMGKYKGNFRNILLYFLEKLNAIYFVFF